MKTILTLLALATAAFAERTVILSYVQTAVHTRTYFDNLATAINALLDEAVADRPELADQLSVRAPLGYGRSDVVFNPIALQFEIVP